MRTGILFLLGTFLFSTQYTEALTPHSRYQNSYYSRNQSDRWHDRYSRDLDEGYSYGGGCCPAPAQGPRECYTRQCAPPAPSYSCAPQGSCYAPQPAPCYNNSCAPQPVATPTAPEVTSDFPTICYTPYCYQVPKYFCVQKCDEIPVYRKKRVCKMVPKYYDQTCWKYVPVSYTKRNCRYEPEYSCVDEFAYCYKQNRLEWQCKYEPRYYYKKNTYCQGKSVNENASAATPSSASDQQQKNSQY